jgi:hypothetical protein
MNGVLVDRITAGMDPFDGGRTHENLHRLLQKGSKLGRSYQKSTLSWRARS